MLDIVKHYGPVTGLFLALLVVALMALDFYIKRQTDLRSAGTNRSEKNAWEISARRNYASFLVCIGIMVVLLAVALLLP
jgi:uncharacterized membrane protein